MWFSMILYVYNVRRTWISSHAVRKIKKSNMKHTFIMNTYAKSVPVPASCAWCHRHQAPAQRSTTPQLAAPQPPVMRGIPSHPDVYSRNPTSSCSSTWEMFFVCHQWSAPKKKWTEWLDLCERHWIKYGLQPCVLSKLPTHNPGLQASLGLLIFRPQKRHGSGMTPTRFSSCHCLICFTETSNYISLLSLSYKDYASVWPGWPKHIRCVVRLLHGGLYQN